MPKSREKRTEALQAELAAFLAVEVKSTGGYAEASLDDARALSKLFDKIIDLKFERDPDGDQVIEYDLVNRKFARMISVQVPNSPYFRGDPSPLEAAQHSASIGRVIAFLAGSADDLLRVHTHDLQRAVDRAEGEEKRSVETARIAKLISDKKATKAVEALLAAEKLYGEHAELIALRPQLAAISQKEVGDEQATITAMLAVPLDSEGLSFQSGKPARDRIEVLRLSYGEDVAATVLKRYNFLRQVYEVRERFTSWLRKADISLRDGDTHMSFTTENSTHRLFTDIKKLGSVTLPSGVVTIKHLTEGFVTLAFAEH